MRPCTAITNITDAVTLHPGSSCASVAKAAIWMPRPAYSVAASPNLAASQPAARFVTIPAASYSRNSHASWTGEKPSPLKCSSTSMRNAPSDSMNAQ